LEYSSDEENEEDLNLHRKRRSDLPNKFGKKFFEKIFVRNIRPQILLSAESLRTRILTNILTKK